MPQIHLFGTLLKEKCFNLKICVELDIFTEYFQCKTDAHEEMCEICQDILRIFKFLLKFRDIHIYMDKTKSIVVTIDKIQKNFVEIRLNFATIIDFCEPIQAIHNDFWIEENIYLFDLFLSVAWKHFDDNVRINENMVEDVFNILRDNEIIYDHPEQRIICINFFDHKICPICLTSSKNDFAYLEGCPKHTFHKKCLIRCLHIKYRCPMCRRENICPSV